MVGSDDSLANFNCKLNILGPLYKIHNFGISFYQARDLKKWDTSGKGNLQMIKKLRIFY